MSAGLSRNLLLDQSIAGFDPTRYSFGSRVAIVSVTTALSNAYFRYSRATALVIECSRYPYS